MTITRETVRAFNAEHANLSLTEQRITDLPIELNQLNQGIRAGDHRVNFDIDPSDFRLAMDEAAETDNPMSAPVHDDANARPVTDPPNADWSLASLTETADAIAAGRVSARDVAEAVADRYARVGERLGCFKAFDAEGLLAAADRTDQERQAGRDTGPLGGVPLAHKDMYYRAGEVSECGSKLRADSRPDYTATVLERLDAAGAITAGRLVMVEFAMGPHGYNANYPFCRNAWDQDYIPCGSSSGSGSAVGARLVHGSLGSDTGGSVRCPAAVNGVTGLLPTYGLVSRYGMMPMSYSLDSAGPLARTARDCARMMDAIASPDPRDRTGFNRKSVGFEAALDRKPARTVIGLARGYFDEDIHPEVACALEGARRTLEAAGYEVVDIEIPQYMSEIAEIQPVVMKAEGAANHYTTMAERADEYTFEVGNRLQAGFFVPAESYIRALKLRGPYLRAFAKDVLSRVDAVLTATLPGVVPTIEDTMNKTGKDYLDLVVALTRNTKTVNYLGLPAIAVPCGFTAEGLPLSFQLIGRPFGDHVLLQMADQYQRRTEWHATLPPIAQ